MISVSYYHPWFVGDAIAIDGMFLLTRFPCHGLYYDRPWRLAFIFENLPKVNTEP